MVWLYDKLSIFLKCCAIQFLLVQIFQRFNGVFRGSLDYTSLIWSNSDKFKTINDWDFRYTCLTEHCNFLFYFYNFHYVMLRYAISLLVFLFCLLHLDLLDICLLTSSSFFSGYSHGLWIFISVHFCAKVHNSSQDWDCLWLLAHVTDCTC